MNKIFPGIAGFYEITVTPGMLATAYSSGTLDVFATPSLIAFMEKTAMESVAGYLPENQTTVGTEVHVTHNKVTSVGKKLSFKSLLTETNDRQLVFHVEAYEGDTLIGAGTHTRFIVDTERFLRKL